MGKILKLEKVFDVLMSFATLVGFASTAVLAWTFLNTKPGPITSGTSNVGVPGFSLAQYPTLIIQGVPFFWIFFSLVTLSAGHTYRSVKHIVLSIAGKSYFPQVPHLMRANRPQRRLLQNRDRRNLTSKRPAPRSKASQILASERSVIRNIIPVI